MLSQMMKVMLARVKKKQSQKSLLLRVLNVSFSSMDPAFS